MTREIRILIFYFALVFVVEFFGAYFALQGINNLWISHFFIPIEYIFWIVIFSSWQNNTLFRKITFYSIPIFVLFSIFNTSVLEGLNRYPSNTISLESVVFIGLSIYLLFYISKSTEESLLRNSKFWILLARLLRPESTLLLFSISNLLINTPNEFRLVYSILNSSPNILANFVYAVGILCQVQKQRS